MDGKQLEINLDGNEQLEINLDAENKAVDNTKCSKFTAYKAYVENAKKQKTAIEKDRTK